MIYKKNPFTLYDSTSQRVKISNDVQSSRILRLVAKNIRRTHLFILNDIKTDEGLDTVNHNKNNHAVGS